MEGNSMLPGLQPKQRLLVKAFRKNDPLPEQGRIIIARHPIQNHLIITKRLWKISDQGLELRGDNPDCSTDSRHFGLISAEHLIGEATAIVPFS